MNALLPLVKIESMSSLQISELTDKRHSHVLRDIRSMISELYDSPSMDSLDIKGVLIQKNENGQTKLITLDESHTLLLTTGYSVKQRKRVIDQWQYLRDQLDIIKFRNGDKKNQINAMAALNGFLPDDLKGEALSYIKANTVVNKAVSNLFGFPKMLNKADMSIDMLSVRDKVLDDYIKLYEVIEDNSKVKALLYDKYQPMRLEYVVVNGV